MINEVTLIGRLGADADFFSGGKNGGCKLSVCTNKSYKDENGEFNDSSEWHNVVVWNPSDAVKSLAKGDLVYIKGELQTTSYEKDGNKKYITSVVGKCRRLSKVGMPF